ncbi:flagellar filament capping protein FliD, partial [Caballeronia sp. M23-90]
KSLSDQQTALTAYAAQLTTSYNAQFTALNTLMSQSTSNASYLTQLFGGTDSAGALATNK